MVMTMRLTEVSTQFGKLPLPDGYSFEDIEDYVVLRTPRGEELGIYSKNVSGDVLYADCLAHADGKDTVKEAK